jgi:ABC-type thiamin/hydroxymethylpyrimidine transport system permease subunit
MMVFSPYGPLILINCAFYTVAGELSLILGTRYRSFSLFWMVVAGLVGGLVMLGLYLIFYNDSLLGLDLPIMVTVIITTIASVIISSIFAKYLADAVARTGALAGTALKEASVQEI